MELKGGGHEEEEEEQEVEEHFTYKKIDLRLKYFKDILRGDVWFQCDRMHPATVFTQF